MSLFDRLVSEALRGRGELAPLRSVVEKELLHHNILREMSSASLTDDLTFMGGTCLRACYGSNRLSEDLDFTGGRRFSRKLLGDLSDVLVERLQEEYGLEVRVSQPVKETGNVSTWKFSVTTRPENKSLPRQRIHIDVCSIPSHDRRPVVLRNHYGVDLGTSGLIIWAESKEEILCDKIVAFAFRPNRIKNRDLWDIGWLKQQAVTTSISLVEKKIADHGRDIGEFVKSVTQRVKQLGEEPARRTEFIEEMRRFLPRRVAAETVEKEAFWTYLTDLLRAELMPVIGALTGARISDGFRM